MGDMFIYAEPMLQISHSDDDLFLTGFTFDEVQTLEMEDFCQDFVAMSFDQHGSGGARYDEEHVLFTRHGVVARLSITQEVEFQRLVYQLQLSDGAPGTLIFALAAPSSPDRMSLMSLYFPDEIDKHGTFTEIRDIVDGVIDGMIQPELASPFDLFGVSTIEVVKEIQTTPDSEFTEDDIVVDGLFDGHIGLVEGASNFVDPPFSFDVLSGFVSRSDDVHDSSFMDLSIFLVLACLS
ncbi:hypothetical protein AAG906_032736 [Vitis piasezkii]